MLESGTECASTSQEFLPDRRANHARSTGWIAVSSETFAAQLASLFPEINNLQARQEPRFFSGVLHCWVNRSALSRSAIFFEPISKRRQGFPSESKVRRGVQIVHGDIRHDHGPCRYSSFKAEIERPFEFENHLENCSLALTRSATSAI